MDRASPPDALRQFAADGEAIAYRLKRSARRSVGFCIDRQGLTITIPQRMPLAALEPILREKAPWIRSKLALRLAQEPAPLAEGSPVDWLGEPRLLRLGGKRNRVEAEDICLATDDAASIAHCLQTLMRREARTFLAERLALWSERLRLHPAEFRLSSAGTRWGSCSSQGSIRLNWRLMQAPLPVIDYVVIHELCHLAELNHSPRFWALVAAACPDWKARRDWLKAHGGRYLHWG